MCLIFAKSAVELLVLTAAGSNQFGRWESWALVLALGVFGLLQVLLIAELFFFPMLIFLLAVVSTQIAHFRRSDPRLPL